MLVIFLVGRSVRLSVDLFVGWLPACLIGWLAGLLVGY